MRFPLFIAACFLLSFSTSSSAQSLCGLTDTAAHVPPNYTTMAPPAYGQSYIDPVFGCTVTRLVNGTHEYSEMSAINEDDTKIVVGLFNQPGRAIVDFHGNKICNASDISGSSEPRWDKTDPNKLWYHVNNQIRTLNATTCAGTVYDTISAYATIGFCGGESDLSGDGDHFCISNAFSGFSHARRYTISTKTLGPEIRGGSFAAGASMDFGDITPINNNIFINFGSPRAFEIYDGTTGVFISKVANWSAHSDRFVSSTGQEMLFTGNGGNPSPGACNGTNLITINLNNGQLNCTGIDLGQYISGHFSCNNEYSGPTPSRQTCAISTDNDNSVLPLPTNWQSSWTPYNNEVFIQNTDGTGRRRLAQHRSIQQGYYWNQSRASISRDGKYVVFDSNFGRGTTDSSIDVYLISVGSSAAASARPSPPTGLTAVVH
jgi:hypothetical protein